MSNKIAVNLLLEQLQDAHKWIEGTLEGVTDEVAHFMPPGKANPIAGVYAHLVFSEDMFVNMLIRGAKPLFEGEWKDKTGISELHPTEWEKEYPRWLREVKVDMAKTKEYQKAVFKVSEEYVASLNDEDLAKEVDMSMFGMGKKSMGSVLGGFVINHARDIMGEISVLKGIQGLKGYPF